MCRYVLESQHMKKFFDYIQLPNFDIAADAAATFKVKYKHFLAHISPACSPNISKHQPVIGEILLVIGIALLFMAFDHGVEFECDFS